MLVNLTSKYCEFEFTIQLVFFVWVKYQTITISENNKKLFAAVVNWAGLTHTFYSDSKTKPMSDFNKIPLFSVLLIFHVLYTHD